MNVAAVTRTADSSASRSDSVESLSPDAFMKLLVAQLQNQDPLSPVQNEQFVLQLSQLTTLQQTRSLAEAVQSLSGAAKLGSAAALIGRQVEYLDPNGEQIATGRVEQVRAEAGQIELQIGDRLVPLASVLALGAQVSVPTTDPTQAEADTITAAVQNGDQRR